MKSSNFKTLVFFGQLVFNFPVPELLLPSYKHAMCVFQVILLLLGLLACVRGLPIMVEFGTRMAPITPPTPRPRMAISFPLLAPAPVYEEPEPENNSIFRPSVRFGFRVKPIKSFVSIFARQAKGI